MIARAIKKVKKETSARKSIKDLKSGELFSLIEKKAYEIFERRGYSHGQDQNDWYEAEKFVKANFKK